MVNFVQTIGMLLASALLFVGKVKGFETRVIEIEDGQTTNEGTLEHRKLRKKKIKEGDKTARKKKHKPSYIESESKPSHVESKSKPSHVESKSKPSHIKFDDLMGKFDQNAPVTKVIPKCLAKPIENTVPTILMSLGRSGSTGTWLMLSTLTNSKDYGRTKEYAGGNPEDNLYFFDTTIPAKEKLKTKDHVGHILRSAKAKENEVPGLHNSEHGEWMVNYLCRLQKERPTGLNGFKWKPNFDQFDEREEARESLQLLASLASAAAAVGQKPPIRVIRNRRNTLDVKLSAYRYAENPDMSDHCEPDDTKCINNHEKKEFIKDIPKFLEGVLIQWTNENMIDDMMDALNVPFISVTYDTLFWADQVSDLEDEWNRMIQWVKPSADRVSWADVQNSMTLASTTASRNHADIIENWEDVYKAFQGTEVEHLFRL